MGSDSSEDLEKVAAHGPESPRSGEIDRPRQSALTDKLAGIQQALRKISQGTVSRTTLSSAVRETLGRILGEEDAGAIPELARLESRLESRIGTRIESRLQAIEEAIEGLRQGAVEGTSAAKVLGERLSADLAALRAEMTGGLEAAIAGLETRLGERFKRLEGWTREELRQREARVADGEERQGALESALKALEERLHREEAARQESMKEISGRLDELKAMVAGVGRQMPQREELEALGSRIEETEKRFGAAAAELREVQRLVPELRAGGERLGRLQEQLEALAGELAVAEEEVGESREQISRRIIELRDLLQKGIDGGNARLAISSQRLLVLRDALRDQLILAKERARGEKPSLWDRLAGRENGQRLNLDAEEWERFRTRLELALDQLDSLIG